MPKLAHKKILDAVKKEYPKKSPQEQNRITFSIMAKEGLIGKKKKPAASKKKTTRGKKK